MKQSIFIIFLFFCSIIHASYEIIDKDNIFTVKTKDHTFKELLVNLEDEINFQSYTIVHKLNLAKSTENIVKTLELDTILTNGINILICKSTFTFEMHQENIENITYCPLNISVYEHKNIKYISYRKYKSFKKDEKIAEEINKKLKYIILESID